MFYAIQNCRVPSKFLNESGRVSTVPSLWFTPGSCERFLGFKDQDIVKEDWRIVQVTIGSADVRGVSA